MRKCFITNIFIFSEKLSFHFLKKAQTFLFPNKLYFKFKKNLKMNQFYRIQALVAHNTVNIVIYASSNTINETQAPMRPEKQKSTIGCYLASEKMHGEAMVKGQVVNIEFIYLIVELKLNNTSKSDYKIECKLKIHNNIEITV